MPNVIPVLIGPTASGKTDVALSIADALGDVEIVSADSRQIYIGMDIGTAKPTREQRARTPHHMIDIISPEHRYTAGRFAVDALNIITDIIARGKMPLVVGGSGFYIKALFEGLGAPPADPSIVAALELRMKTDGYDVLYDELLTVDPKSATAHPKNNRVKTLRALACWIQTGLRYSEFLDSDGDNERNDRPTPQYIGLMPDRKELYQRINDRVENMIDAGLINEVEQLLASGHSASSPGMKTVGYKEVIAMLNGEVDLTSTIEAIKQSTRRYAKRQMTWLRGVRCEDWYTAFPYDVGGIIAKLG